MHKKDAAQGQFLSGVYSFSFSLTGGNTKVKSLVSPTIYQFTKISTVWLTTFSKSIRVKWTTNSLIQDLNLGHCAHFQG